MQVRRIGYGVKGLYRIAGLGLKWGMIAPDTGKRLKILKFWHNHGLAATMAAFEGEPAHAVCLETPSQGGGPSRAWAAFHTPEADTKAPVA
ncbi:MAG: hypothetical protein ACREX4_10295 [Gammaproteobacteria bacterium]